MSGLGSSVRKAVHTSGIWTLLANAGESRVESVLQSAGVQVGHMARHSFLVQWLTKEPEPEVIVIDLRETWTVGPIIGLLNWLLTRAKPYWQGSTLKRALDGVVALGERTAETWVGQLVAQVLTPPDPPESSEKEENP